VAPLLAKLFISGRRNSVMQLKLRQIRVTPRMPKVRVNTRTNVSSALKLEAERLRTTFANLRAKGVSSNTIRRLIELKKKADKLRAQANLLTKNRKVDAKVVSEKAKKASEFFYKNLLRYSK